jgi:stage V sporulation protein D (sporulation-specific penicillin-binding protein)
MFSLENRLRIISLCLALFALLLVGRLYFLQIIEGENFEAKADHQYVAGVNYFDRGTIFFTTKDGTLIPGATIKSGFTLSLNPNLFRERSDLAEVYTKLTQVVPLEEAVFLEKARKEADPYEELFKRLDNNKAQELRNLKIPGLSVTRERWRAYPGVEMAAHTLGLLGYLGDDYAGRYGLERSYEEVLARDGDRVFVNFFAEIFHSLRTAVSEEEDLEGDIVTTIEPSVEAFLEKELSDTNTKYSSEFTGGIVIDPHTGEIRAMAITPTFDPNTPASAASSAVFSNPLIENRYEMGSIIKALTYAIGLEAGSITAKSTYNDPGCMTLNTETFCNYDGRSHGSSVTMQEALGNSLNTGAAQVALRVGTKKFSEKLLSFGLAEKTGIDLPNEGGNLVSNLKTNRDLEAAQASFGQGIALTPINTVRALSSLANGGTLITPHLVKEIHYKLGPAKTLDYGDETVRPRVLTPEAVSEISRMLVDVVDNSLRYGQMRLENYSVAAKTGTAQIANPSGGGYYADRYLHSFFGYFPAYEPEYLVFLFTYYPKGVQYASETLVDSFFNITKFLINYYDIPPDRDVAGAETVSLD